MSAVTFPAFLAVNVAAGILLLLAALAVIEAVERRHRTREHRPPITIKRGSWQGRTCYRWRIGSPAMPDLFTGKARTRLGASLAARVTRRRDSITDWRAARARQRSGRTWTIR